MSGRASDPISHGDGRPSPPVTLNRDVDEMIERLRADVERHDQTLGEHGRRIGYLDVEMERTRKRLHLMEGDREALQKLVDTTKALAEQTRTLAHQVSSGVGQIEELAEAAAEKAVQKAAERLSESRLKKAGWLAAHATGVGTIGSLIAYIFLHH